MLDTENQSVRDLLIIEEVCSEDQLVEIQEEHDRSGKSFKEIIVDFGFLTEEELLQLMANNIGSEVIDLSIIELDENILTMVDPQTARMNNIIPVAYDGFTLTVATANPLNYQMIDELRFVLNMDVIPIVASEAQIDENLEKYYPPDMADFEGLMNELSLEEREDAEDAYDLNNIEDIANDAPIVRFVDLVLYQAIQDKASDVHFEPFENEFKIRYRIDGALYEMAPPPKNLVTPVISRVKIMSGLNISETRLPQDGRIQLKIGGKPVDLRVSTLPTAYGESVVLRILDRSVVSLKLDTLGIAEDVLDTVNELIHRPNGIFVVTGPTGSGKSTTLYSCLGEVNKIEDKLLTAEDPVEYDIEGIIQVPINDAVGMTFAKALKAFLRQDPDRIMLGEIRDVETAKMSIEASLTGHFVYSTLHTNDAAGAVTRLIDMGIEPFLISSSLVAVLGQRLIRKVCPNCKTSYIPSDEDLESLNLEREDIGSNPFYYGKGCIACNDTGYKGRKAINELLVVDNAIKELILEKAPTIIIREKARELGMRTIREDGIRSILSGETTMEEVLKYT
jgi:type IV pilus assembly protein PilB